jgi:large subunit ribosomal protein L9
MKLILTQEVAGLGEPGDVIEVKDGYGRNYLLPRGFALKWTRGAERQIELIKKARSARQIASMDHAREVANRIGSLKVTLATRAGANGRLFGSVTAADIAAAVKRAGGPDIDRRRIEMSTPIKTLGSHQISVRLHPEVHAVVALEVVGD